MNFTDGFHATPAFPWIELDEYNSKQTAQWGVKACDADLGSSI